MTHGPAGVPAPSAHGAAADNFEQHGTSIARQRPDLMNRVSDAQRRVLELLLAGLTEPQIAERLGRSRHTVHDHTKAIYQTLAVNNRVQLVLLFSQPAPAGAAALIESKNPGVIGTISPRATA